jgi:hypothetical protein
MSAPPLPPRGRTLAANLACVALGGACVALGFGLGRAGSTNRPAPAVAPDVGPAVALAEPRADAASTDGLVAELRRLHEAIEGLALARSERSVAVGPPTDLSGVQRALEGLKAAMEHRPAGSPDPGASAPPRTQPFVSLARELAAAPAWNDDDQTTAEWWSHWVDAKSLELTRQHLLWTTDQLLAAYGTPFSAQAPNGGLFLEYAFDNSATQTMHVGFTLATGRVTSVQIWSESKQE